MSLMDGQRIHSNQHVLKLRSTAALVHTAQHLALLICTQILPRTANLEASSGVAPVPPEQDIPLAVS